MFLWYLCYINLPFQKNLTQALQSNILSAHKVITGFFKKSKSKAIKNLSPKVFFITFSLVVTVMDVRFAFSLHQPKL